MKILWIAFVWPEPQSSAAGMRTLQLIRASRAAGHEVRVTSPCQDNDHRTRLAAEGIVTAVIEPNDSGFDQYINEYQPDIVFFDRFMIEEQFSWRVREHCPRALRVLDTIDLHSLRRARRRKVERGEAALNLLDEELNSEDAIRELSAIYRSDLSLIVSPAEIGLLTSRYGVPEDLLALSRVFYREISAPVRTSPRKNFVTIGNFNHAPNMDSFKLLHETLWKKIRTDLQKRGADAIELHVYGAYPTAEFLKLDDQRTGFRVKGWAEDSQQTLGEYRVNLAPLRFGAGFKGKIADGWVAGTPCVTTAIGAEGMHGDLPFGGLVEDDWENFTAAAARLYIDAELWETARANGLKIVRELFDEAANTKSFLRAIDDLAGNQHIRRPRNLIGAMLWHHQRRSSEFFSRWIEAKNKLAKTEAANRR